MPLPILLVALMLLGATVPVTARPWSEPGDQQLRQDIERLRGAGLIRIPVNAWPLPWKQINRNLAGVAEAGLRGEVASALRRVRSAALRAGGERYEVRASMSNAPAPIRDFGGPARDRLDMAVGVEQRLGGLYVRLGGGYRAGQDGGTFHAEPSFAALSLGNLLLYGGYVEHWWGPGRENTLLFSNNARPFPKIGAKLVTPEPIDAPVLRRLGTVQVEAFAGVLTEQRGDFDNPAVAGIRVAFAPAAGLEIGLNRALQLCGDGRPCGVRTVFDALLPTGNVDNTGTLNEPGNQLAGFDVSYTQMIGPVSARLYVEAEAEDENHFIVEQYGRLAGLNLAGPVGRHGGSWELRAEFMDTLAAKLFGTSWRYQGSFYNHHIYRDGFTYGGRAIGSSLDGDGDMLTLSAALTDARDRRFHGSFRSVRLNRPGRPGHRVSTDRETLRIVAIGAELPTAAGDVSLEVRAQDDAPGTAGRKSFSGQVELGWRVRL